MNAADFKRKALRFLGFALIALALFSLMNIFWLKSLFDGAFDVLSGTIGLDAGVATVLALISVPLITFLLPSLLLFLLFGVKSQKFWIALAVICTGLLLATMFKGNFDRSTGKVQSYYIRTVDGGFKLSSKPDFDPETGEQYQPMTTEIAKEIARQKKGGVAAVAKASPWQNPVHAPGLSSWAAREIEIQMSGNFYYTDHYRLRFRNNNLLTASYVPENALKMTRGSFIKPWDDNDPVLILFNCAEGALKFRLVGTKMQKTESELVCTGEWTLHAAPPDESYLTRGTFVLKATSTREYKITLHEPAGRTAEICIYSVE